ncbi:MULTISPECIES: DUF2232 domain-containing protein [Brevibacillus]|uniref:DUF2232 domain-containing protein n=1 Tax=Brevibacillus TaxID=55080 RepID=UPI000D10A5E5|nr:MULTISPECIES: DUF2232 domain-containing protein [Brevibacillus]PSJ66257.1 DUF2232 domain-containing protein [Brevibacillus brevis]RED21760.1 uncharacterized protein YybS (DUF2232 family) [Brevibacillus brevis]TQK53330.1 uncharacterized protein YybS (DUF2232 family) [Brevibacillus sp. AG162]VEF92623.1 Predicted membrane protein [Brevibacillus brevis]GEC92473.1 membrane protein [Brevibacillus brevis]
MPSKTKHLAENALMLGIALVLLFLSTYTVLGGLVSFLIPLPFILLAVNRTVPKMVWISLAFTFLGWIITGPFAATLAFSSAVWGSVMGIVYTKKGAALPAIVAGAGVAFLSVVSMLAFMAFGMNVDFNAILQEVEKQRPAMMPKEQFDQFLAQGKIVLPTSLVMFSFLSSAIIHGLASLIGRRLRRPIPALKPIREWSFPRSLLYYYFIAMISLLLFAESMQGTFWEIALMNLKVMLDAIFVLQGLSFCLFAAYLYGWKRLTPVLCLFIFTPLSIILSLVGIFDLGMRLREKLETRVKRG